MHKHARHLSLPLLLALIASLLLIAAPAHASPAAPAWASQQVTVSQVSAITTRAQQYARLRHLDHLAHLAHLGHLHVMHTRYLAVLSARAAARQAAIYAAQHPVVYQAPAQQPAYQAPVQQPSYQAPVQQAQSMSTTGGSGYEACVIRAESGGNSQVMNSTGHYGLFQFDYGTWVSGGGSAASFGNASVAQQQAVFNSVYASRGSEPWSSDGC